MAMLRKRKNLLLTIFLILVIGLGAFGIISLSKKVDNLETTKTVSASQYARGLLDNSTGKLPRDSADIDYSGIHMNEYINADGIKVELEKDASIKYEINFFDEDHQFISVVEKTADYDGTENPTGAKFVIIEIVPLADADGIVSSGEMRSYAKQLKVTYNK